MGGTGICRLLLGLCAFALSATTLAEGNLLVRVRTESYSEGRSNSAGIGGGGLAAGDSQRSRHGDAEQTLMVMDGGEASISVGQTRPLPLRQIRRGPGGEVLGEALVVTTLGNRLSVRPQARGDRVVVSVISREGHLASAGGGALEETELSTTVSGRWGEWLELGGRAQSVSTSAGYFGRGGAAGGEASEAGGQRIWLRVDPAQ